MQIVPEWLLSEDSRHRTVLVPQHLPRWPWPLCLSKSTLLQAGPHSFSCLAAGTSGWNLPPFSLLSLCLLSLNTSQIIFIIFRGLYAIVASTVFPLSIPGFFSILNFHDTVRKCGAGPCRGTLCPVLRLWTAPNFPSRRMIKAKGGPSLSKIAKTG